MARLENLSSWGVQHSFGLEGNAVVVPHFPCATGNISEENRGRLVRVGLASLGIDAESFEQLTLLRQSKLVIKRGSEISSGQTLGPTSEELLLAPREAVTLLSEQLNLIDPKRVFELRAALVPPAAGSLGNRLIGNS